MPSGSQRRAIGVDPDKLIAVGVIRRAHGVRGEASVELLTDGASRFEELRRVFLVHPDRERVVESSIQSSRPHRDRALVKLEGIESPEAIGPFRDWTIEVPEGETRELDEDEFFLHDLVGLAVVDTEGKPIGTVIEALEGVAQVLLRIERPQGNRFEVPFVKALCPDVDLERGTLVVALPEGLIDLNEGGD